jgi:CDP-glucose 4,6-dehydratase
MRYLVTGHTGFKGSWLSLWLQRQGHEVVGVALDPLPGALYEVARVAETVVQDVRLDIREADRLAAVVSEARPDVVMHLAAQPLVRESYRDPVTTFTTNVDGTMNVLRALQGVDSIQAALIITTDKVYRNVDQIWGYKETDPLGGEDPYSASKAMADLLTQSWVSSFDGPPIAIARAGNVIGGGDVSPDRLLPDLINAYSAGQPPVLRYPGAVRPWQHVLDCLHGYLTLIDAMLTSQQTGAWNFGPDVDGFRTVGEVNALVAELYEQDALFDLASNQPEEANLLALDARKAQIKLGWRNRLEFADAVRWTVDWHQAVAGGRDPHQVTLAQIDAY